MSISATQRARLGAFMIGGMVLLFVFAAIPVGFKLSDRQKKYHAFFEGESLSGLEQGAVVKFHGVPVGTVEKISYDPGELLRVRVEMRIQYDFPLKEDMFAQTGMMGITGLKYVEILGGSNDAPLRAENAEIPTKPSMMSAITGKAEVLVAKVEILLNHLNQITHPESLATFKSIVGHVEAITDEVRLATAVMRPELEQTTLSFRNLVATADSIARDVKVVTDELNNTMTIGRLSEILAAIDSSVQSVKNLSDDARIIVRQSREDILVSMDNLREALENANALTRVLSENPSLLIRGEQPKERRFR